ncbi:MAG: CIA30 family protein [Chthoniobacterales bacterium]|jgi:NADH dehydrogenase [ubiquinone] 1 alpha subcomplex assembly factor 1|nr:CIA30 family protein [Chthoniobacterales bacterium]
MLQIVTIAMICVLSLTNSKAAEPAKFLFNFTDPDAMSGWQVEDDVVMGGLSQGKLTRDPAGYLVFRGEVSLENNGGFSSVQNNFTPIDVSEYQHAVIRLKGDGKDYRFIVESDPNARHYYVAEFTTKGGWQEINISLRKMYPMRRGDRLDIPDYPGKSLAQVRFMIANGRAENFQLEIASIALE